MCVDFAFRTLALILVSDLFVLWRPCWSCETWFSKCPCVTQLSSSVPGKQYNSVILTEVGLSAWMESVSCFVILFVVISPDSHRALLVRRHISWLRGSSSTTRHYVGSADGWLEINPETTVWFAYVSVVIHTTVAYSQCGYLTVIGLNNEWCL